MVGCMSYVFYAWFFFLALGPYSLSALVMSTRAYAIPSPASSAVNLCLYLWRRECRVAGSELVIVCRDSSFSGCRADAEVGSGR